MIPKNLWLKSNIEINNKERYVRFIERVTEGYTEHHAVFLQLLLL